MIKAVKGFYRAHRYITLGIVCVSAVLTGLVIGFIMDHWGSGATKEVPTGLLHDTGIFGDNITVYDSNTTPATIYLAGSSEPEETAEKLMQLVSDPELVWAAETYAGNHTMVEQVVQKNGAIGVLSIDKLGLSANVYDSGDESMMADMQKGIAHFSSTSSFDGCVGVSAHNINFDGSPGYFVNLHTLSQGDEVRYSTSMGSRTYTVQSISAISETDWSPLSHTDNNQIVMITCISGQPDKRLCVTAVERTT